MPDITLTINGVQVTVPAGTNLVDAARQASTSVPVFCYHPKMKPVGMCRMCLVQIGTPRLDPQTRQPMRDEQGKLIIQMQPKLVTACTTPVSEGMVVNTLNEEVQFAQRGILEFLLTSHPLDCPVCDKGGECPLQNLTMGWGPGNSRFDYTDKVHFEKPIPLGNLIYLDRERCILCGRCVRFEDELADDNVLGFDNRGRHWEIISKSDPAFDSKFSGNTTDICPVGALTSADFRFRARVWELKPAASVCPHCPVGCNITLDMRHNQLMRVMPRENDATNEIWICDKGRYGMRFVEDPERLNTPLIRRGERLEPASWDAALGLIAEKFQAIKGAVGGKALAGLAGDRLANEDLYAFQRFFREVLESPNLDHRTGAPDEPADDDMVALAGIGSGSDLSKLGKGTTVLVIGADPEEEAPVYLLRLRAIAQRGGNLIVANARPTKLDRSASSVLPLRAGSEAQLLLGLARLAIDEKLINSEFVNARLRNSYDELRRGLSEYAPADMAGLAGLSLDQLRATLESFARAENAMIVYGREALQLGPALSSAAAALALLTGKAGRANNGLIALLPAGNSRGALDMGVRPDKGPGYTRLASSGLGAAAIWNAARNGNVRGMFIAGIDPAASFPASRAALEALEFLVVQDLFLTPTAQLADVVLPALSFAEYDGTFTNAERRVQRFRKARSAAQGLRGVWQVAQDLAQLMTANVAQAPVAVSSKPSRKERATQNSAPAEASPRWDYLSSAEVAADIAANVAGYAQITHTQLAATASSPWGPPEMHETGVANVAGVWDRQMVQTGIAANWNPGRSESIYYDGTSYANSEGVGLQWRSTAEEPRTQLSVPLSAPITPRGDAERPLILLTPKLLYDGDEWLRGSLLRQRQVAQPQVIINRADAERLGIANGERVRISSARGTLELPARIGYTIAAGIVIIPVHLPGADVSALVHGPRTPVSLSKLEGTADVA